LMMRIRMQESIDGGQAWLCCHRVISEHFKAALCHG
jgi:hypothetical protein